MKIYLHDLHFCVTTTKTIILTWQIFQEIETIVMSWLILLWVSTLLFPKMKYRPGCWVGGNKCHIWKNSILVLPSFPCTSKAASVFLALQCGFVKGNPHWSVISIFFHLPRYGLVSRKVLLLYSWWLIAIHSIVLCHGQFPRVVLVLLIILLGGGGRLTCFDWFRIKKTFHLNTKLTGFSFHGNL